MSSLFVGISIRRFLASGIVLLTMADCASAEQPVVIYHAGSVYEVSKNVVSNGTSVSSVDRDTLMLRVVAVRSDGMELEYDLPATTPAQARVVEWRFPVRIYKPNQGPSQLLNGPELEVRAEAWLKKAGLPRSACGHYVFTWNVFRIECDPQSVVRMVASFDLGFSLLEDGALYSAALASQPATLRRKWVTPSGAGFDATLTVDPDLVRQSKAEADVVVAEITRKPLSLDDAVRARSAEQVSGTIAVTFETDAAGVVQQRTTVVKLHTMLPNGPAEDRTTTETVQRRFVSGG
jgi:hypothetical protein